jgi:thymidylate synthase
MNNVEQQYLDLVKDILENGHTKSDRTKTGTKSVFGRTIRHRMSDGFPLLTTKKMAWKTMVTELLWFLRGDTNIKYLVDNDCYIWVGDAYKRYCKNADEGTFSRKWLKLEESFDGFFTNEEYSLYTQEEFINKIKTDDEFAKKWGELGNIYGAQWRRWKNFIPYQKIGTYENGSGIYNYRETSIDQIANAIHLLKTDPDSRRILVSAWNVGELDQMVLPPCHYSFQFYTRELSLSERYEIRCKRGNFRNDWEQFYSTFGGYSDEMDSLKKSLNDDNIPTRAISLLWNQRSVDVGLGLPFNIASYALLLEIIAKQVNMIPEEVIGNLGDCHIYLNHVDGLKEQMTRTPYELPTVKISDRIVNDISEYTIEDFTLENYVHHPAIKLPLSN